MRFSWKSLDIWGVVGGGINENEQQALCCAPVQDRQGAGATRQVQEISAGAELSALLL